MTATAKPTVATLAEEVATLKSLVADLVTALAARPAPVATQAKPTIAPDARVATQRAARAAGEVAYHEAFAILAKEHGGVNAKNRASIEEQANAAGRCAAETVYLSAGYVRCPADGCDRLVTPGYAVCPKHA